MALALVHLLQKLSFVQNSTFVRHSTFLIAQPRQAQIHSFIPNIHAVYSYIFTSYKRKWNARNLGK
jgi:hypothetical protein